MADNRSGNTGVFFAGMLLGATAGAVAGLLLTPRTGRETRRLIKKAADALPELAEDLSTTVQIQANRVSDKAAQNWDGTLDRLKLAIAAGLEASQRDRELQEDPPPVASSRDSA